MAHPSPLSAPFAAYEVAVATEAASKAKSLVIVTGSDLRAAFPATMIVRSCVPLEWVGFGKGEPGPNVK
jgi:hypothetical protein